MTVYAPITFEEIVIVMINNIVGARSRKCLITRVRFELFVIGYPHDSHVNYECFNGFFRNVFFSFQNSGKALGTQKEILIRHF